MTDWAAWMFAISIMQSVFSDRRSLAKGKNSTKDPSTDDIRDFLALGAV